MATLNYKVAGFSSDVKSDLGLVKRNDFRRDGAYSKDGITPSRFVYNFDGVDDYAVLATRAINPDGDIDIEWTQRGVSLSGTRTIITQCDSATNSLREFYARWESGKLSAVVGGATIVASSDPVNSADGVWRITYSGSVATVRFNGATVYTSPPRTRGASREPSAPTRIGVLNNGGSLIQYLLGSVSNLKIGSQLWQMATRNSTTQVSTPDGNSMTLVNTTNDRWQEIIP